VIKSKVLGHYIPFTMDGVRSTVCQIATIASSVRYPSDRLHALLANQHAFVWRSLRRLGVPDSDVDDACQRVFLVAHRHLSKISPESERSFIFQTALRVAADWRRAHKRRREQSGMDLRDVPDTAANPEELMDQRRARVLLDHVLGSMPMQLRAVFVLFELEEMTMMEISVLSNIPPGTVASRLRRARQIFQETVTKVTAGQGTGHNDRGGR
jgi:RNA polymerase sigma-70 factor (ECF subfamily)